ncbi:MAG: 4a-hydroxytetrahydrobiopterin dehydratase [Planctomycetes bacterium]|nr:4a-hydroxytetrahydrobiopterin dehydratase [Planctomycetota bacterium]
MSTLSDRRCVPVRRGDPALTAERIEELRRELATAWLVVDARRLRREWKFPDFASAMAFTVRIGLVAEREDHHPEIELGWGRVAVELWTHVVGGLTENDFVIAAKLDRLT